MAETFGKTDKGGTEGEITKNYAIICQFTSGSAGTLEKMSVYLKYIAAAAKARCAIYDIDQDILANGTTEEKDILIGQDGWIDFLFGTPPTVAATTAYLLCYNIGDNNAYGYFAYAGVDGGYKATNFAIPWPAAWGGFTAFDEAREHSIYATYEEAPPVKTLVQVTLI